MGGAWQDIVILEEPRIRGQSQLVAYAITCRGLVYYLIAISRLANMALLYLGN